MHSHVTVLSILLVSFVAMFLWFKSRARHEAPARREVRGDEVAQFWRWFATNEESFARVSRGGDPVAIGTLMVEPASARLSRLCSGLSGEVGLPTADGARPQFTITANGAADRFSCVESIVAAAPPLRFWSIVALRQRRDPDWTLVSRGRVLAPSEVRFREKAHRGALVDIVVLVPDFTESERDGVFDALFPLLDSLVGERDVELRIGEISLARFSPTTDVDAKPLSELPMLLDSL